MSVVDIDRDEWRSARDHAWADGTELTHRTDCRCAGCATDELTEERT